MNIDIKKDQEAVVKFFAPNYTKKNMLSLWNMYTPQELHVLAVYCTVPKHTNRETAKQLNMSEHVVGKLVNTIMLTMCNMFTVPETGLVVEAYYKFSKDFRMYTRHKYLKMVLDLSEVATVQDQEELMCLREQLVCMFIDAVYTEQECSWSGSASDYSRTCWYTYDADVDDFDVHDII